VKKAFKTAAAAALIGLMSLSAAGCGDGDKAAEGTKNAPGKDTLRVGVTNFADSLEPTDNYFGWVVMRYGIGESLVKLDNKVNATPWLADKWSVADDNLTWTFHINDKAVFSNGNKVTAEAVKNSLERTFAKAKRATTFFEPAEMKADGQNLIIKTKKPIATLPGMLSDPLFLIVDTSVKDRDYVKMGPICTGPYVVKNFTKANCSLVANEKYWNGTVPFKKLEVPSIDDPNTRAMSLQSGETDVIVNVSPQDMALFSDKAKYHISEISSLRTVLARLNVAEGHIFHDKAVRQALIMACDRQTYADKLLKGQFIAGKAPIPPSLDYGFDSLKDPNAYNPDAAKKLLADAGYKDANGDGYLEKDGKTLEADFLYYTGRPELPMYAEATQADAKKIGIKINLKALDYNVLDKMGIDGKYDLLISNIITAQAGSPEVYMNGYWKTNVNGNNPQNGSGYSNAEYDKLSDQLAAEFDPAKRKDIIIKMEQILLDDAATLFFGYPKTNMISSTGVSNAEIQPIDYYWVTPEMKPAGAK